MKPDWLSSDALSRLAEDALRAAALPLPLPLLLLPAPAPPRAPPAAPEGARLAAAESRECSSAPGSAAPPPLWGQGGGPLGSC